MESTDQEGHDVVETDPEAFDCETCAYRLNRERLGEHDRQCMRLHEQLALPVVRDLNLSRLVFDIERVSMTRDEADSLLDKLQVIHDYAINRSADLHTPDDATGGDDEDDDE